MIQLGPDGQRLFGLWLVRLWLSLIRRSVDSSGWKGFEVIDGISPYSSVCLVSSSDTDLHSLLYSDLIELPAVNKTVLIKTDHLSS